MTGRRLLPIPGVFGDTTIVVNGADWATTAADGSFVLLGVSPGDRTLEARRPSTLTARGVFTISAGVTTLPDTLLVIGDVWADQRIDVLDSMLVAAAFGRCSGGSNYQAFIDVNADGCVNAPDLDIVGANYGRLGPTDW